MTDQEIAETLRRMSDRVANLIFHADVDWIDIEIAINEMRDFCREHLPERLELFEMIYPPRFERLWEQFGPPARPRYVVVSIDLPWSLTSGAVVEKKSQLEAAT